MGISDGFEGGVGDADCSVGAIVWVRRRNGSWWPGRILDSNEVAASHLMSPRSGTPVKLLGREDASVDWYNLEKSKRVKAFRCGEFEECIERAEISQGIVVKKREKYARREDAILHALELERQQLEKKQKKLGIGVNGVKSKMSNNVKRNLGSAENIGKNHCKTVNTGNSLYSGKDKHGRQPRWDDTISESLPRMRGLQDIGLKIASKKRKLSGSGISEGNPQRPIAGEYQADDHSNGVRSIGNGSYFGTSKNPLAMKRKNTLGSIVEGSPAKRRDRRRPLVQVLQKSVKLLSSQSLKSDGDTVSISMQGEKEETGDKCRSKRSKCVYLPAESNDTEFPLLQSQIGTKSSHLHPDSLTEESNSSGLREDEGSDFSERGHLNHQAIDEEMTVVSDATQTLTAVGPKDSGRSNYEVQGEPGSSRGEELDESVFTGVSQHQLHDQTAGADVEVSKWQLKGKRNSRNLTKRAMDLMDGENYKGSVHGIYFEGKRNSLNRRVIGQGYHVSEDLNYGFDEEDLIEKDPMQTLMWGYGNRRYTKAATKDHGRSSHKIFDSETLWEADGLSRTAALRGYWDDSGECFDPIYDGHSPDNMMEAFLVEVDLKVQASYQGGEHVPLVSLMSRLNGKAIVGHPVQVEAVEDGSSYLLCTNGDLREEHVNSTAPVPPVWRTGRRTVMHRVPRPHRSSALEGEEEPADHHISDLESKPPHRKAFAGHLSHNARLMSKNISNIRRLPTGKKNAKKHLKKVSFSSQKTRMLSSIATEQKRSGKSSDPKLGSKSSLKQFIKTNEDGGLIPSPTIVTCIPVKLVYSRLLEAVGRPPSRKTESRSVLINGHTETKENHSS